MKKLILTLGVLGSLALSHSVSAALLPYNDFRDLDIIDEAIGANGLSGTLSVVGDDGDSISYDIAGFDPSNDIVTNVALAFTFYQQTEGGRNWARVDFNLSNTVLIDVPSITFGVGAPTDVFNFSYVIDTAGLLSSVSMILIADVQDDGMIDWSVGVDSGAVGVHLFAAALGVEAHAKPVPDSGTTLAMLGACVFGIVVVRRRFGAV